MKKLTEKNIWIGIDIGSTTAKTVAIKPEDKAIVYSSYERHNGKSVDCIIPHLKNIMGLSSRCYFRLAITGSQGGPIAETLEVPFVQEVIAETIAVRWLYPSVKTAIELGGQDAKIVFLSGGDDNNITDMRMNGVCAGGTGAFLDQMAGLLAIPVEDFDTFASRGKHVYKVSGRCGVFAKTDIQPLLNQGAAKGDIALSCMHALAKQTIGGLAQGKVMESPVLFAGGPFFFNKSLLKVFKQRMHLTENDTVVPENAQVFVAYGAALSIDTALSNTGTQTDLRKELAKLSAAKKKTASQQVYSKNPFFNSVEEKRQFRKRHAFPVFSPAVFPAGRTVDVYIGIDAGSTTTKFVAIDGNEKVIYKFYSNNKGDPLITLTKGLLDFYNRYTNKDVRINVRGIGTTGYGEMLVASALKADFHTVETIAHKEAACFTNPEASFILDLGGQDMKAIFLNNGIITNIVLNEACSAGCGSFLESFAQSLSVEPYTIAECAFSAEHPSSLGSRCTVFMNSSVITEQKNGKSTADILAGLCMSIIENLFTKVVRINNFDDLGETVIVQGGTFRNDAVLRAFEQYTGRHVIRPAHSGEMGALGMALLVKKQMTGNAAASYKKASSFIGFDRLAELSYTIINDSRCPFCSNHCMRRIVRFNDGSGYITGNRCERGGILGDTQDKKTIENVKKKISQIRHVPDLMKERYKLLFPDSCSALRPLDKKRQKTIGIPRVLDFYESMPFWYTFFSVLGYRVVFSDESSYELFEKGLSSVPSDTVCLPAKIVHGHIQSLLEKGVNAIFMPIMIKNIKENRQAYDSWNCAVLQGYPEVIRISEFGGYSGTVLYYSPALKWGNKILRNRQIIRFAVDFLNEKPAAIKDAIRWADLELLRHKNTLFRNGGRIIESLSKSDTFGVVLSCRPYQGDMLINHRISDLFTRHGIPVLINESLPGLDKIDPEFSRLDTNITFHTRMLSAAKYVADHPCLEMVHLFSFGCGHDAVICDEMIRILRQYSGKELLVLKMDEGENAGPLNIRVTSFIETVRERRKQRQQSGLHKKEYYNGVRFTKEDKAKRTILIPNLSRSFNALMSSALRKQGYRVRQLPMADKKAIQLGKRYVHNDMCYPAQINIGEILSYLVSHRDEVPFLAAGLAKNCKNCRALHYHAIARKALDDAGFSTVPVVTTDLFDKSNKNSGFKPNKISLIVYVTRGLALIDALDDMLRKCRPYECVPDSAEKLFKKELDVLLTSLQKGWRFALRDFKRTVQNFNNLACNRDIRKPRVGIIGEILVNYHESGNYNVVGYLEQNGMEVVLPALSNFWRQNVVNYKIAADKDYVYIPPFYRLAGNSMERFFTGIIKPVEMRMKKFKYYEPHSDIHALARNAAEVFNVSFNAGEGWLLPGEIIEWIKHGINSILIVQPFGCLPNHISGKGVIKEIKAGYPHTQILSLDFDPDTSIANVHNRLQMIILNSGNTTHLKSDEKNRKDSLAYSL